MVVVAEAVGGTTSPGAAVPLVHGAMVAAHGASVVGGSVATHGLVTGAHGAIVVVGAVATHGVVTGLHGAIVVGGAVAAHGVVTGAHGATAGDCEVVAATNAGVVLSYTHTWPGGQGGNV
mmetsp:Transcript_49897/g.78022  ORF Transcript_49897/g.78022 Transcript_49897/m.78022 type:complete len:120 (+) Transcript_49897:105-464(+)